MAIDTAHITRTATTRTTGPLVQPVHDPDPFSLEIEIMNQPEQVTVPGVLLHDPEFAGGYACGRASYFSEVCKFVDQAGHFVESFTESQLPFITSLKVRDITDQDATNFMAETMAWECEESNGEPIPLACRTGFIFGYVHACIEAAHTPGESAPLIPDGFVYDVRADTGKHQLDMHEGWLHITCPGLAVPLVTLSPEEAELLLDTLLVAKHGLTAEMETAA